MIWNTNYINLYLSARRTLNSKNLEKTPLKQIKHLSRMYNDGHFQHYKRQVFLRWFSENTENTLQFIKRSEKLIKKLEIELSYSERMKIENIRPREFTFRRSLKTIEAPYKDLPGAALLKSNIVFFYKNIRTYQKGLNLYEKKYDGEIHMSTKEVVFYDREKNKIQKVIKHDEIKSILLRSFCVEIEMKKGPSYFLRYKDDELIYISLSRSVVIKNKVEFNDLSREEGDTAERTIESFLNID